LDTKAAIKYMSWNNNQWVSYDDDETIALKKTWANAHCLGGTMVWALDLADPTTDDSLDNMHIQGMAKYDGQQALSNKRVAMSKYAAIQRQNTVTLQVFWTDCQPDPQCPVGFTKLTEGHGKIFDADRGQLSGDGCHGGGNGYNRALCVESNVQTRGCAWYGKPKGCKQQCPANSILISMNTHIGGASTGCQTGRFSSFCCTSIESDSIAQCGSPALEQYLGGGKVPRIMDKFKRVYNYGEGTNAECLYNANPLDGIGDLNNRLEPYYGPQYIMNGIIGTWVSKLHM